MKRAIQPTSIERKMRENDFIVSKTNPKGIITYGNPIFIEFSGYTEAELLGSQHNIIRHPDMPRAAFKLAWDTIQSGREFFGYVKNMSKDGTPMLRKPKKANKGQFVYIEENGEIEVRPVQVVLDG